MINIVFALTLTIQTAPAFTPAAIDQALTALSAAIADEYLDTALTPRISSALKDASAAGQFASATTPEEFARRVNQVLYSVTHDKHLNMQVVKPPPPATAPAGGVSSRRDQPTNAGFRRVEILPGNIGLLELTMFLRPIEHRDALAAAMKTLEPAEALIIDMRANGGGSPGTVALLLSYLFDEPELPLFEIIPRNGDRDAYQTEPASVSMPRNGRRPIFVLTSSRSFSGGEGFAYLMQERKRGVIIGERTAGAANPGRSYPVSALFEITIPNGRIRSAIKHGNWEGDGVTPDIAVPAAEALDVAIARAREALKKPAGREVRSR